MKSFSKKNMQLNKKGFSFVEVLVTLAILTLSLAAISVLVVNNVKSSGEAKNQIIATGLVEEGIELVRNLKDGNPATFNSASSTKRDGNYIIDKDTTYAGFGITGSGGALYLNAGGFYVHSSSGNIATKFHRRIVLSNATEQVMVISYVNWNSSGSFSPCTLANKCVYVTSIMQDAQ